MDRAVRHREGPRLPRLPRRPGPGQRRAGLAYDHDPLAIARQAVATVASGDRTGRLRSLHVPAVVIHGIADPMCDVSGGRATAAAIPGAELVLIEGIGRGLPSALWDRLAELIARLVERSAAPRRVLGQGPGGKVP
jgi:pimeloyl-ACP methyl ester carboxylesterase